MKIISLLICCLFLSFLPTTNRLNAQPDSVSKIQKDTTAEIGTGNTINADEDEFNLFLLTFAMAFFCAILIASFIGAVAALVIIIFLFLFISGGILSTAFVVGFYKKSFAAGFRTFMIVLGMVAGASLGAGGLWLSTKFFKLNLSASNSLVIGAAGGCIGGILLGLIIFKALQMLMGYFKNKLKLPL